MIENAITKLKTEIEQSKNNPYIQIVGGFLLQHLDANPQDAEKIMAADKTISKSLDAMKKEAQKKKVGNCAVLTDQEGFSAVLKYFGIDGIIPATVTTPKPVVEAQPANDFDIRLEDLL
ncbi:MAG: hypothetical protein ACYC4E_00155 [Carboxydocellales bacterium]